MPETVRRHPWMQTTLGPIATWPVLMRSVVDTVGLLPMPALSLWGPDGVAIYNDAYAAIAGDLHPQLLGSSILPAWPEAATIHRKFIDAGLRGTAAVLSDQRFVLHRQGRRETAWFSVRASPIIDDEGRSLGALCLFAETTDPLDLRPAPRAPDEANSGPLPNVRTGARQSFEQRQSLLLALADEFRLAGRPRDIIGTAMAVVGREIGAHRVAFGEVDLAHGTVIFDAELVGRQRRAPAWQRASRAAGARLRGRTQAGFDGRDR